MEEGDHYMEAEENIRIGHRNVRIRLDVPDDAAKLLVYLRQVSEETHYMIRYADEVRGDEEEERQFLEGIEASGRNFMLSALELDEEGNETRIVGNVGVNAIGSTFKVRHRASLGIALIQEYCGKSLGTILMKRALELAAQRGYTQMELGVFEDNPRAFHVYEKMGFAATGKIPNAFRLRSGEEIAEIQMVKRLTEDGAAEHSDKERKEAWKRKTRENETALLECFCTKKALTEHMARWTDDKIPDKYDQNFFECSGQPSEEEFREALRYQKERGDHFIKLESREPLSPDFGLEREVTLTMVLTGDCSAWRENPQVTIRKPEEAELVENELRNFGRIYGEDFTVRNAKRNYETLDYVGAYLDGKLAGSCYAFTRDGVTCIDGLVVNEESRHRYVASTLLKYIAMANRENLICLHADEDDTPKEMYRKMGFVVVDANYEYTSTDLESLQK